MLLAWEAIVARGVVTCSAASIESVQAVFGPAGKA